ncbi:Bgt-51463, partial [Blumeria graminis f. sp. tritici]
DQIIFYVESSPGNRRKTFQELASCPFRHLGVSEQVIQTKLQKKRKSATCGSSKASSISENYEETQRMGRSSSQLDT